MELYPENSYMSFDLPKLEYIVMEAGYEPVRAHTWDAGLDLRVSVPGGKVAIYPGCEIKLGTKVKFNIPQGFVGFAISRSGLEAQLHNSVGVIDAGYQGEVFVRLRNPKEQKIHIEDKQRVLQLVLVPIAVLQDCQVTEFSNSTERGENGFHSSGKQ
jgi:dUTP pyrophosphatase